MKKTIFTVLICTIMSFVYGQDNYSSYKSSYLEKEYNILVSSKEENKYSIYIMATSFDNLYKEVGFYMKEKELNVFRNKLIDAKNKYNEWVKTAKENNVTDLDKEMKIEYDVDGFFSTSAGWKFDEYVNISFHFKILEGKYMLLIRSDKLVDMNNQFIDHDGFIVVFSNEAEIDSFLNKISEDKIIEFINKPKKTDLFN